MKFQYFISLLLALVLSNCSQAIQQSEQIDAQEKEVVVTGAERISEYLPLLKGRKVGLLVNHTSLIGDTHLLDTLLSLDAAVKKIYSPEHGFRGKADAGEQVDNAIDTKTSLPIISLYGKHKKPTREDLTGIDVVIFDSQDVGARFFTYFSTMQYMMEACAENGVQMIVLDRPNPNGHYVDGPVLEMENKSFVGMNPVPIVFGLTAGEYAQMIVGENWISQAEELNLTVIEMEGWDHSTPYSLTTKPSPNLPNDQSIALYPSLCLFEGTNVSVGRGTLMPFQIIGFPDSTFGEFVFTPISIDGMSKYPPYEGEKCFGLDLRNAKVKPQLDLSYLIDFYTKSPNKAEFFNSYFVKLAGTAQLQQQIEDGWTEVQIRKSWQVGLKDFKEKRKRYLLYE